MPDPRECIVLGVEGDEAPSLAVLGLEGCLDAVRMPCHLVAQAFDQVADVVVGLMLLISDFRVVVDLNIGQIQLR